MWARDVDYRCGDVNLRGYLACDEGDRRSWTAMKGLFDEVLT